MNSERDFLLVQLRAYQKRAASSSTHEERDQWSRLSHVVLDQLQLVELRGWEMTKKQQTPPPVPEPPKVYRNYRREAIMAQRERSGRQSV